MSQCIETVSFRFIDCFDLKIRVSEKRRFGDIRRGNIEIPMPIESVRLLREETGTSTGPMDAADLVVASEGFSFLLVSADRRFYWGMEDRDHWLRFLGNRPTPVTGQHAHQLVQGFLPHARHVQAVGVRAGILDGSIPMQTAMQAFPQVVEDSEFRAWLVQRIARGQVQNSKRAARISPTKARLAFLADFHSAQKDSIKAGCEQVVGLYETEAHEIWKDPVVSLQSMVKRMRNNKIYWALVFQTATKG